MSHVDQVGSRELCEQGPVFIPGVDADQHFNCRGLSPEGQQKLLGRSYQCGGRRQGPGEYQTGFHGAQMSGG